MPGIGDQSWHFNIYWGTKKTDSRIINSTKKIEEAKRYFNQKEITKGLKCIGESLHPIQDIFAHTRDVCYVNKQYVPENDNYGISRYTKVEIWFHLPNGVVDNARKRTNQLYHAALQSKKILSDFVKKYSFLRY